MTLTISQETATLTARVSRRTTHESRRELLARTTDMAELTNSRARGLVARILTVKKQQQQNWDKDLHAVESKEADRMELIGQACR